MAQRRELDAEIPAARLRWAARPEQLDQRLTGMRAMAEEGQVGEQGGALLRAEALDDAIASYGAQPAHQLDAPPGAHGVPHGSLPPHGILTAEEGLPCSARRYRSAAAMV